MFIKCIYRSCTRDVDGLRVLFSHYPHFHLCALFTENLNAIRITLKTVDNNRKK